MRTFGDLVRFTRDSILRDTSDPFLWSDETLCECIATAHDEFAERTLSIRDSSSPITEVELIDGVSLYSLDPVVLAVISGRVAGATADLVRASAAAIDGYVPPPDVVSWLEQINYGASQTGTPMAFTTDDSVEGTGQAAVVRVWPTPAAADNGVLVRLRVARLPIVVCSLDTLDKPVECSRQFLMGLCHGAAAIAYTMNDVDGNDQTRADGQRKLFDGYIARAAAAARRKMFAPTSWGFGRGGFSHSR